MLPVLTGIVTMGVFGLATSVAYTEGWTLAAAVLGFLTGFRALALARQVRRALAPLPHVGDDADEV